MADEPRYTKSVEFREDLVANLSHISRHYSRYIPTHDTYYRTPFLLQYSTVLPTIYMIPATGYLLPATVLPNTYYVLPATMSTCLLPSAYSTAHYLQYSLLLPAAADDDYTAYSLLPLYTATAYTAYTVVPRYRQRSSTARQHCLVVPTAPTSYNSNVLLTVLPIYCLYSTAYSTYCILPTTYTTYYPIPTTYYLPPVTYYT